jgi:hypothetical protein
LCAGFRSAMLMLQIVVGVFQIELTARKNDDTRRKRCFMSCIAIC